MLCGGGGGVSDTFDQRRILLGLNWILTLANTLRCLCWFQILYTNTNSISNSRQIQLKIFLNDLWTNVMRAFIENSLSDCCGCLMMGIIMSWLQTAHWPIRGQYLGHVITVDQSEAAPPSIPVLTISNCLQSFNIDLTNLERHLNITIILHFALDFC